MLALVAVDHPSSILGYRIRSPEHRFAQAGTRMPLRDLDHKLIDAIGTVLCTLFRAKVSRSLVNWALDLAHS